MTKIFGRILLMVFLSSVIIACEKEEEDIFENPALEDVVVNYVPIEMELMKLVNEHRVSIGLNALIQLNLVSKEASPHTSYMVQRQKLSHDNFETRLLNLVNQAAAKRVGENVGFGYHSAKGFLNGWLSNPEHRTILERDSYTHFGISAKKNIEGRFFITQIFIEIE